MGQFIKIATLTTTFTYGKRCLFVMLLDLLIRSIFFLNHHKKRLTFKTKSTIVNEQDIASILLTLEDNTNCTVNAQAFIRNTEESPDMETNILECLVSRLSQNVIISEAAHRAKPSCLTLWFL